MGRRYVTGGRLLDFEALPDPPPMDGALGTPYLDADEQVRRLFDSYERVWLPEIHTTDAESRARRVAEAVTLRAFEAWVECMESLLRNREMRSVVWMITDEGASRPYAYPVETPRAPSSSKKWPAARDGHS